MDSANLLDFHKINFLMELFFKVQKKSINFNLIFYLFLIWNAVKLFLINSDPIIQSLNLLLSIGIYFCLEDMNLQLKSKKRLSFFIGIVGIAVTFFRFYILLSTSSRCKIKKIQKKMLF